MEPEYLKWLRDHQPRRYQSCLGDFTYLRADRDRWKALVKWAMVYVDLPEWIEQARTALENER